ncbi:LPD38 domain-containing protein [Pseudomonas sp. PA15(2017)]|uniref:LPD38 domain-containing protein n=1 Tax=Pseudomonas sp. PA15(2017) TaxID=1932111 RepID=UPI00117B7738|nr:LPD38 domain-containing protein [Pseudomonas sp. PA15(2017)]
MLEELPQSIQEQMLQNWAEQKPLMQGVARAGVEGALAGSAIGGAVNVARRRSEEMGIDPAAGPLSSAAATAVDSTSTPVRDATRSGLLDGAPEPQASGGYQPLSQQQALAQEMFPTDVDADGSMRYFRYDRDLQTMVEVPEKDALAAAKQQLDTWAAEGFDPQDGRALDELVPQVDEDTGPGEGTGMAADDLSPYERNQLRALGVTDEQLGRMTTAEARSMPLPEVTQDSGPLPVEDVSERPPLPTVEMDTGPQQTEQVQGVPVAGDPEYDIRVQKNGQPFRGERDVRLQRLFNQLSRAGERPVVVQHEGGWAVAVPRAPVEPKAPLALPAPSTMVVDSEGTAERGPAAPYVNPANQVRPLGGPGMERQAPVRQVDQRAQEAATSPSNSLPEPSEAQIEAGNYRKGHVRVGGLDITIENPRGSVRRGKRPDGSEWAHEMSDHYGYIRRTEGADGEQVDVYVGPRDDAAQVFVVDQVNQGDGSFDEHKVMIGYPDRESAIAAYRSNFDEGWKVGPVTQMAPDAFRDWLRNGDLKRPLQQDDRAAGDTPPAAEGGDGQRALSGRLEGAVEPDTSNEVPRRLNEPARQSKPTRAGTTATENLRADPQKVNSTAPDVAPKQAADLPEILTLPRKRYIDRQAKAAGLKKGSPGYDQAIQRLQSQYEADVDRASAGITIEQFNALNSDSPESLNRQAWEALRKEFGQAYSRNSYRTAPEKPKGARAGQLRMAIAQITRDWKNAPAVTVVQSIKDLPTRQRQRVERDGAFDVEGIFADGKVYLVADNLTGARHAAFVLQHEVLGHAGLQGAYGNRLTPLLMSIYSSNAQVKAQADALVQRLGYTKAVATEEVLADMAGAGTIARQPFWQRLVTAMRNTFRSLGLGMNWTEGDIQGLLANARAYIENGRQQRGARAAFSRNGQSGRGPELVDIQGRLLAPNGKPSLLNQRQWHQVRSDNFKRWFGDWKAASAMERLAGMVPVRVRIPEDWRGLSIGQLRMKAKQAMQDIARSKEPLVNDTLGEVEVSNNTGVRKFISGGADPAKLHLAADLRETFRKAIYTSSEAPSDRAAEPNVQAYEKLIARAEIDGQDLAVVFTVQRTRDGRQFYNATTLEFGQKETPAVSPRDTPIAGERATSAYTGVPSSVDSTGVQAFSRRELERVNPDTVSKVTDGNGEPLVVYHGTTGDFDAFARETIGSNIVLPLDAPRGFYFAKDQATADRYAAGEGANVMPVFVAIKNPAPSFADFNADTSYDGFINSKMVVARNPEQVKSATANVGTFDPADSDIRYSRASQRDTEALRKLGLAKVDAQSLLDQVRNMTLGGLQTKMREWSVRSEEGVFDGLAGIRRAEEAVGVTDVNQQGYVSARMASGIADVMHGVLHYAAPEWRDGVVSGKANTRGVLEILGDLGPDNLTPWLAWLGGKRAQLLKAQGRENNLTDAEISELVAMGKGNEALFEKVYREYAQVNEAVLDLAQEAGLIDQDARAKWLTDYYVPFYRQDESEGIFSAPRSKRGLSHQTAAIKALKGGDLPTNDLLANMLAGWTKRIDASMKNKALLEVVGNLQGSEFLTDESPRWQQVLISRDQIAQQIRKDRKALALAADLLDLPAGSNPIKVVNQLMKPENEGFEKVWTRVAPTDPDIIRVQRDGKAEYYRVNDESLLRGLKFMEGSIFNDPITKIGRAFKRILTTGVTASPDFILRNFIRDAAHAWVINKDGFTLGKDSIKGMRDALREDADYRDLMFAGGSFQGGYVHGADPEASAQIIRRALEKKGFTRRQQEAYLGSLVNTPAKAAAMLGKGWQHYRELGDKVENANRLSTYKAAIAAGKSRRQASYEAKDLMDYSLRGNFAAAQWFTDVVPFLNARLQGLYKLGRAVKGDKTLLAKEVAMKGGYIALFSLLLAGINDDDERYKALMDWDKDMHWHIFLGDEHFRIPKPFELGLVFGTVPERILHAMTGTQDGGDLAKAVSHGVFDTLAFNPVPQFYQPIRELQANRNFFRDSPIEDMSDEGKLPEARYDERTSTIGRLVGQVTGPIAGVSPKQVDHLIAAYTGTLGQYVLDASSLVTSWFDDAERPASRSGDIPILKVIYQGNSPRSTKYQSEFYDMMREADQLNRTIKSYREEGRLDAAEQLMSQNREKLRHRPALGLARKQLGNIRNQMDAVYRDTAMTPEQKRQRLDALQVRANGVAERIVNLAGGDF